MVAARWGGGGRVSRLHLPHPHIAARVAAAFEHALHHGLCHSRPAATDPAAIERWAEWLTPSQWEAEHGGKEDR